MKIPKAVKLPSGSWRVRVTIEGKTISVTMPTKKEAEGEALRLKMGDKAPKGNITLIEAVDSYIDSRRAVLSPATIRGYVIIRDNRFQSLMKRDVFTLTSEICQRAIAEARRDFSPKTIVNSWGFISSVIEDVTGSRIKVELPKVPKKDKSWLTPQQIPVFLEALKGDSVEIPALLALSSLRASEILDVKWEDINLKEGNIRVYGAVVPDENNKMIRKAENKNYSSSRYVPIIPPLRAAIQNHKGELITMTCNGIYKGINRVCRSAGLPEVGIHGLRHSFASLAKHLGLDEKTTMLIGGWSDDRTMHKIYTHIAEHDIKNASDKFTSFFEN